jgi:Nucleotidyl transferase AbiEii toxin, Type IV TA system
MNTVAKMPASQRALAFEQAAAQKGVGSSLIIEKDFWVCWALKEVFSAKGIPAPLFKGGTSLSKAYGLIERFSEDVDLVLDRHSLGFEGESDPAEQSGSNKRKRTLELLADRCASTVQDTIRPILQAQFEEVLGDVTWTLQPDPVDPQTLNFSYPTALKLRNIAGMGYLRPVVRLEFGCRGDVWPTEKRTIRPYLADYFPQLFVQSDFEVMVLTPERTFWEKVTLLHATTHSDRASERLSRHYYDVSQLYRALGTSVLNDHTLLAQVVKHKEIFFRSASANYESALPGSLRITPGKQLEATLRKDWREMEEMLFGVAPTFDEILADVQAIENHVNSPDSMSPPSSVTSQGG